VGNRWPERGASAGRERHYEEDGEQQAQAKNLAVHAAVGPIAAKILSLTSDRLIDEA